jgi:N-acetylmuramoyl-L-alanine amidase
MLFKVICSSIRRANKNKGGTMKSKISRPIGLTIVTAFIIMMSILGGECTPAAAQTINPQVILNGQIMTFEVPPIIENDRTLVPLRAIFEAMGAVVNWDDATQTVTATKGGTTVVLPIGSTSPSVNFEPRSLDVAAKIVNNRTLLRCVLWEKLLGARLTGMIIPRPLPLLHRQLRR